MLFKISKSNIIALFVFALIVPLLVSAEDQKVVKGEYLVSRRAYAPLASQTGDLSFAAQEISRTYNAVSSVSLVRPNVASSRLPGSDTEAVGAYSFDEHSSFCSQLRMEDPSIEYCEPNYVYTVSSTPNDSNFSSLWGMQKISAPAAWDLSTGSNDVVVAVVDTGVDYTHPDLVSNIWTNPHEIAGNHIDDDANGYVDDVHGANVLAGTGNPFDDNMHGTHVAGTIGAAGDNGSGVAGVNWHVKIMGVKFLSSSGSGTLYAAIQGINYAAANGARVINASWGGGGFSQALYDSIRAARDAGVLFVAAAGNSGLNTDTYANYPSAYELDNIIAVAATGQSDRLASFSNYGVNSVDIAAPGVDIFSTIPGGYATLSGTSMATPHVAGVAALVLATNPSLGYRELRSRVLDGDNAGLSSYISTGKRLNAYRAITSQAQPGEGAPSDQFSLGAIQGDYGRRYLSNGEGFSLTFYGHPSSHANIEVAFRSGSKILGTCSLPSSATDSTGYGLMMGKIRVSGALRSTSQVAVKLSGNSLKRRFRTHKTSEARRYSRQELKKYATLACNSLTASVASHSR